MSDLEIRGGVYARYPRSRFFPSNTGTERWEAFLSASLPPGEVPIVATPDAKSSHTEVRILWTGFLRNLWKEIFEFRSRPILLGVIFGLSIGTTLAAGNLNIQPPPIRIQLYQPGPDSGILPNFNDASTLLQQYSNVRVIRMAGSFLDLTAMQRDGAHYAVVPRGDSWVVFYNFTTLQQEEQTAWFINVLSTSLSKQKPLIAEISPVEFAEHNRTQNGKCRRAGCPKKHRTN